MKGFDAGGRDHRVRRVHSPVLLQPELARASRRHRGGTGQHQRLPRDPILRSERMVGMGDHDLFVWIFVILVMAALWWMDRSRAGAVLRAVGEDELAAQSVGISLTAVKVTAMTVGGFIAGIGGAPLRAYGNLRRPSDVHRVARDLRDLLSDPRRPLKRVRHPGGGHLHSRRARGRAPVSWGTGAASCSDC